MKIYRNTFYFTFLLTLISLMLVIISYSHESIKLLYDLSLGVFGSALLTAVSSILAYFIEEKRCLEDYYRSVETIINKISKYEKLNSNEKDLVRKAINNVQILQEIFKEDLRLLGDNYSRIACIIDFNNSYRNFIFSSYEYIQDLKYLADKDLILLNALIQRESIYDNFIRKYLINIENMIFRTDSSEYTIEDGTTMTYSETYNKVSDDLISFLDLLLEYINNSLFRKLKNRKKFKFNKTFIDNKCFEKVSDEYRELFKKIVVEVDKQQNKSGKIVFNEIDIAVAKDLLDKHYISGYTTNKENGRIDDLTVTNKLYYYERFLKKFEENLE